MNPQEYLNSFINFESHLHNVSTRFFNLARVHRLLSALGDPHKELKFIHVAGTKGKGSTCTFIASILLAAGYRVGLYTSPHLYRINERIRVLEPGDKTGERDFEGSISDSQLRNLLSNIKAELEKFRLDKTLGNLTYFEVLTVAALCYFSHKKTDIVVLETGLGGRLDATNAIDALVNVITPIGFDHMHLLGKTLGRIACEKAAIIKHPFSKVVVAQQDPEAMKVILKQCRDHKIKPVVIGKKVKCFKKGQDLRELSFDVQTDRDHYKELRSSLVGGHQIQNAASAVAVIELLPEYGFDISPKAVRQGIRQARWPGRFEIIKKSPMVIVDCAHNVDSARALVRTFKDLFPGRKAVIVLGISADKDVDGVCRILNVIAHTVILTRADHPRAHTFDLARITKIFKGKTIVNLPDVKDALRQAYQSAGRRGVVLATGSVFLAAELRAQVKHVSV